MPNLPRLRRPRDTSITAVSTAEIDPGKPRVEEISAGGLRWVNIEHPGAAERAWLEEHFDFHALDIEDVLSRNQRPKIDEYPDYLFLVLHVPVFDRKAGRLGAGELDLFVGPDFVVTLPNQALPPVEYLFERCRADENLREKLFSRGSGYLMYRLVDDSFDYCFPMLRKIGLPSCFACCSASSPHGCQATGWCWCWRRYGDADPARRLPRAAGGGSEARGKGTGGSWASAVMPRAIAIPNRGPNDTDEHAAGIGASSPTNGIDASPSPRRCTG